MHSYTSGAILHCLHNAVCFSLQPDFALWKQLSTLSINLFLRLPLFLLYQRVASSWTQIATLYPISLRDLRSSSFYSSSKMSAILWDFENPLTEVISFCLRVERLSTSYKSIAKNNATIKINRQNNDLASKEQVCELIVLDTSRWGRELERNKFARF